MVKAAVCKTVFCGFESHCRLCFYSSVSSGFTILNSSVSIVACTGLRLWFSDVFFNTSYRMVLFASVYPSSYP